MRLAILALASLLAACGGSTVDPILPDPQPGASVYKSLGSVQCTGGGTTLAAIQKELSDAGIGFFNASCGIDGLGHLAVCGAGDGKIAIFDIPQEQLNAALAHSFGNVSSLPNATRTGPGPC